MPGNIQISEKNSIHPPRTEILCETEVRNIEPTYRSPKKQNRSFRFGGTEFLEQNDETNLWFLFKNACFELVLILVSQEFHVDIKSLKSCRRGQQNICIARQASMYLLHTSFSIPYQEVGEFLHRDRTTIAHGCCVVEDMRDKPDFEKKIQRLEVAALAIQPLLRSLKSTSSMSSL